MENKGPGDGRSMDRRIDRRTFVKMSGIAGGAILVGLPLLGCQPAAAPAGAPKAAPKELFSARYGGTAVFEAVNYAPHFVAQGKGWFKEEGIEPDVIEFKGGAEMVRALETGDLHYGHQGVAGSVNAIVKGAALKIVAGVLAEAGTILFIVPKDSPIQSLKDIKGKSIGFSSPGSLTHYIALKSVEASGFSKDEVKLVPVGSGPDAWTAAKAKLTDVAWSADVPAYKLQLTGEARIAWAAKDLLPRWQDVTLLTSEKFIAERGSVLRGYIRALIKGQQFIRENPEEAVKLWVGAHKDMQLPYDVALATLKSYSKDALTVKLVPEGLEAAAQSMRELGMIKPDQKVPWEQVIDQQFLPENLRIDVSKLKG